MIKKYIIVNATPIIFDARLTHADVGDSYKAGIESAGMFILLLRENQLKIQCFGESLSLEIKSRPQVDSEILQQFLFERQS